MKNSLSNKLKFIKLLEEIHKLKVDILNNSRYETRVNNIDAVITISNELTLTPSTNPSGIKLPKNSTVNLFHLSWASLMTECEMLLGDGKKEFNNWLNSFGLSKPIVQDRLFYMGISYDGKPNKLINIFAILISMINEDVYSEDKRYFVREGCKPRDCGNKGFLWVYWENI